MKNLLIVSFMVMCASNAVASKKTESSDIYLVKTQGEDSFSYEKSIFLKCKLGPAQLKSIKDLESWVINAQGEKERTGMHIMSQVPSIEYSVFYKDKKLILKKDYSTLKYRDGAASRALIAIMDNMCKWK